MVRGDVERKNAILILPELLRVSSASALFIVPRATMLDPSSDVCFSSWTPLIILDVTSRKNPFDLKLRLFSAQFGPELEPVKPISLITRLPNGRKVSFMPAYSSNA